MVGEYLYRLSSQQFNNTSNWKENERKIGLGHTVVSYQNESFSIKMRAALLAPILPRVMKEGESKKAAFILMRNSHCDTVVSY